MQNIVFLLIDVKDHMLSQLIFRIDVCKGFSQTLWIYGTIWKSNIWIL